MTLDPTPLMDREEIACLSQTDHISRFNEAGRIMAAMPDFYEAGKSDDAELIQSLRADCRAGWIVPSTRIHYQSDSLEGTIIHYFGSTVIEPVENEAIYIPDYSNGKLLDDVLATEQGLAYFQVLFNTTDGVDEIRSTLQRLSGKSSQETKVWTPNQGDRKSNPDRAAGLVYISGNFRVVGYCINSLGRSRGVSGCPAGAARENASLQQADGSALFSEMNSGINKKAHCVYLSDSHEVGDFTKYSGMFCFSGTRYVVSLTTPVKNDAGDWDKSISTILAKENVPNKEKLDTIHDKFSPMYACLEKYVRKDEGYVMADKIEGFDKPRRLR